MKPNHSSSSVLRLQVLSLIGILLFLNSCASLSDSSQNYTNSNGFDEMGSAPAPPAASRSLKSAPSPVLPSYAPVPESRPGLGTAWGNKVSSRMGYANFVRSGMKPFGKVGTIYYNDKEGIKAMSQGFHRKTKGREKAANGLVEWGIKQGWFYSDNIHANGKRFVTGTQNRSYAIVIKNICHSRVEAVVSVDGLDVMNGKKASVKNRGYIIQPGDTLEVKGFRTSEDAVAAFKFSGVADSYSNERHSTTRNVGVIGLAVFTEKGRDPWKWSTREVKARGDANPFAEAAR